MPERTATGRKVSRQRLVEACYIMVRCWDRSKDAADFATQAGAHIEDMREMVRNEMTTVRRTRRTAGGRL